MTMQQTMVGGQMGSSMGIPMDIENYVFFCSEHPMTEAFWMSNWFNHHYLEGSWEGEFWCSEQELMLAKLSFCTNKDLTAVQAEKIMATKPKPIIPVGDAGWEAVWEFNHDLASKIKNACRLMELELDILAWNFAKGQVMIDIAKKKFRHPFLAAVLKETGEKILVEAAHYDREFGVGLQAAVHRPRGKPKLADKSILELDANGKEVWKIPPGPAWGNNLLGKALMTVRLDYIDPLMKTHVCGQQSWKCYRCIVHGCGFKGVYSDSLDRHMLAIHACKGTLSCKISGCDYTALSYMALKTHMQIHTEVVSKEHARTKTD